MDEDFVVDSIEQPWETWSIQFNLDLSKPLANDGLSTSGMILFDLKLKTNIELLIQLYGQEMNFVYKLQDTEYRFSHYLNPTINRRFVKMVIEQTLINGTHYKYLTEVNDEIVLVTLEKQTSGRFLNPSDVRTTVYVGKDHNDAVIKNFQFFNIPSGKQVFFQFITGQFVPLINAAGFPLVRVKRSKVAIR